MVNNGACRERLDKIRTAVSSLDPVIRKSRKITAPPPPESRVPTRPWTPQLLASQVRLQSLRWSWQERGHCLTFLIWWGPSALLGRQPPPRTGGETQPGAEPCWEVGGPPGGSGGMGVRGRISADLPASLGARGGGAVRAMWQHQVLWGTGGGGADFSISPSL